jgi:hypothetical protein
MKKIGIVAALVLATCVVGTAQAEDVMIGSLKLTAAWARATPKRRHSGRRLLYNH